MAESEEVRASHEEVEGFVTELRQFHVSLPESERAMLETILEGAVTDETGGYLRRRRYGDPDEGGSSESQAEGWNDLVGWIEEQGDEDAQGFIFYHEVWRQRPEELRQEVEKTRLIGRLKKAGRERNRSPEDTPSSS